MEVNRPNKSIWGRWWAPLRKWVYPAWLAYEASFRFYEYSMAVYGYLISYHVDISFYLGNIGATTLEITCSVVTFLVCTAFLTAPACFLLYKFFQEGDLTKSTFEKKMKVVF